MNKHYYIQYIVDAGYLTTTFDVIKATSIGNAYFSLCRTQGAHYHGEIPASEEDAITRMRKGKSCSIHFCFLIPPEFDTEDTEELSRRFGSMSKENFARQFAASHDKLVSTGVSDKYPDFKTLFCAAEQPIKTGQTLKLFKWFK